MKPLVSICTLAYNQEKFIEQCLLGMLNQKCRFDFEILIHDDASTDKTADIITKYADKYPDIVKPLFETENQYSKYIREKGMANISAVFNFPRAEGKYIAMCEGDDYWNDEDKLEKQIEYMEANDHCMLTFHSAHQENEDAVVSRTLMRPYKESRRVSSEEIIDKKSGYPMASMILRKEVLEDLPDFYLECPIGDIPMQLLAASRGYAYYFDIPMSTYRFGTAGSWSRNMLNRDNREKFIARQEKYSRDMKKMYDGFDRYTDYLYKEYSQRAWKRLDYGTKVNTKNYKYVFADENREFFNELSPRMKFSLCLERLLKI